MALEFLLTPESDHLLFFLFVREREDSLSIRQRSIEGRIRTDLDILKGLHAQPTWFPFIAMWRNIMECLRDGIHHRCIQERRDIVARTLNLPFLTDDQRLEILHAASVMEKTLGDISLSVKHIHDVAQLEGGLVVASSLTLLNLSACMVTQGRVPEAIAVARQAVARLTPTTPAHISAAAYHNLAAAMEAGQDLEAADKAYRRAEDVSVLGLGDTHSTTSSVQRSYASFLCRTQFSDAALQRQEWEQSSRDTLISHTRKAMVRSASRLNPSSVKGKPVQLPSSVANYHLRPLAKINAERLRYGLKRSQTPNIGLLQPKWNGDPIVGNASHALKPLLLAEKEAQRIEDYVTRRYVPKWLIPALEDVIYKQIIRRNAMIQEEKYLRSELLERLTLHKLCAYEKEKRVYVEAEEYRNRRQKMASFLDHGKVLEAKPRISTESGVTREGHREALRSGSKGRVLLKVCV